MKLLDLAYYLLLAAAVVVWSKVFVDLIGPTNLASFNQDYGGIFAAIVAGIAIYSAWAIGRLQINTSKAEERRQTRERAQLAALRVVGPIADHTEEISENLDLIQEVLDQLINDPPSSRDAFIDCEQGQSLKNIFLSIGERWKNDSDFPEQELQALFHSSKKFAGEYLARRMLGRFITMGAEALFQKNRTIRKPYQYGLEALIKATTIAHKKSGNLESILIAIFPQSMLVAVTGFTDEPVDYESKYNALMVSAEALKEKIEQKHPPNHKEPG